MTPSSQEQAWMSPSRGPTRAPGHATRRTVVLALLTASLALAPALAHTAEQDARPTTPAGESKARVSQYARFSHDPKLIGAGRGSAAHAVGFGARKGGHGRR